MLFQTSCSCDLLFPHLIDQLDDFKPSLWSTHTQAKHTISLFEVPLLRSKDKFNKKENLNFIKLKKKNLNKINKK